MATENGKKIDYMQAVWHITESLRNAENIEDALSDCLEIVIDALGCEAGTIWMLNKSDERLYPVFNSGPTDISGISIANGQGIAGSVVKEEKAIIVEDCEKDERFSKSVDEESGFVTRSMICVPLKNKYECLGCIQMINRRDGKLYDKDDLELCENLASLTAIAIDERGLLVQVGPEKKVLVSLRDVRKDYVMGDNIIHVLQGINLDIYENEFLVVLGESGCGKSTMLNIIGGMDFMTSGELRIEGEDFSKPTDRELTRYRRDYVGFIFQSYNLMPNLTAKENLEFITEITKDSIEEGEALDLVGLSDRKDNYPAQMSGGQQQRVSIARAIVKKPRLILADEPTAALDFTTGQEILMVIENIIREKNTTVVMITHNVEIAKMANRVVKLKNGKVSSIKTNMHPMAAAEIVW